MNNAEIIKGIDSIITGLECFKKLFEVTGVDVVPVVEEVSPVVESNVTAKKSEEPKKEESENPSESKVVYTEDELRKMKYNEFKKYAASLGVDCKGKREEIMQRILDYNNGVESTTPPKVEELVEKEKSEEVSSVPAVKKKVIKKVDKKAEVKDEFMLKAEAIAKDTTVEDIIEALSSVDVKATIDDYLPKLAKALKEGLIEVEDDEQEETTQPSTEVTNQDSEETPNNVVPFKSEESKEEPEEELEFNEETYFVDYDPEGVNDPERMTDARYKAVKNKMAEIVAKVSSDDFDEKEIESYLEANATQDEADLLGDEYTIDEEIALYCEMVKRTIDDEGNIHTPANDAEDGDPYEVNGEAYCCGHKLKYVNDTNSYVCEHCGAEYEADED